MYKYACRAYCPPGKGVEQTKQEVNLNSKDIKPRLPFYQVTYRSSDIYRYAEQYSQKYFDIEENLTSSHIYFFVRRIALTFSGIIVSTMVVYLFAGYYGLRKVTFKG